MLSSGRRAGKWHSNTNAPRPPRPKASKAQANKRWLVFSPLVSPDVKRCGSGEQLKKSPFSSLPFTCQKAPAPQVLGGRRRCQKTPEPSPGWRHGLLWAKSQPGLLALGAWFSRAAPACPGLEPQRLPARHVNAGDPPTTKALLRARLLL